MKTRLLAGVIGVVPTICASLTAWAVSTNQIDYATYAVGETPCGVALSVFAGMDSRGFSWQLKEAGLVSTEVQLLKGEWGPMDAEAFASDGRVCVGTTRTTLIKNLFMDPGIVSHCASFTGLSEGIYSYRIGATYEESGEHWIYGTFTVKAEPHETVRIVNMNEAQTKDLALYYQYANTCASAAKQAGGADQIDFVLDGGDFFVPRGTTLLNAGDNASVSNSIRWAMANETAAPYFPGVPWMHVGGVYDDRCFALACPEAFALTNSPSGKGTTFVGCHSLVIGNVYVATLPYNLYNNSEQTQALTVDWLKADLAASHTNTVVKWRVVALHGGPYTTGGDSIYNYAERPEVADLVKKLTPIFAAQGVDLVLQARDCSFSKTVPYRWEGRGYTTDEADAEMLNLAPDTETADDGLVYDIDPRGTYYVSAGCAGHRVGENVEYADRTNELSFVHRNYKVATGKIKVASSVSAAGDDASKDTGKQMFAVLEASGDRLVYKFYLASDYENETSELYDYVAIRKTEASDVPITPYVEPEPENPPPDDPVTPGDDPVTPGDDPVTPGDDPTDDPDPTPPVTPTAGELSIEEEMAREIPTAYPQGLTTVQEIIDAYNNAKAGDVIYVAPGTYDLTGVQMSTVTSGSAPKSHLSFTKSITLVGTTNDASAVVFKADGESHRVLMFNKSDGTLTVSNITFSCGHPGEQGGGVFAYAGDAYFVNCRFVDNDAASSYGGGVAMRDSNKQSCHFRFCSFINNRGNIGAGLRISNTNTGSAYGCTFRGNKAIVGAAKGGGAAYGFYTNCVFVGNICDPKSGLTSSGGGALYLGSAVGCSILCNTNAVATSHGGATYKTTPLINCNISGNYSEDNAVVDTVDLVDGCTIEDNACTYHIVRRTTAGSGIIRNSIFRRNQGSDHLINEAGAPTRRAIYNCLIESNSFSQVVNFGDLYNCTVVGNSCADSPLYTSAVAVNCVFSGNTPQDIYASKCPIMTNCVFVTCKNTIEPTRAIDCKQVEDVKFADPANGNYYPKNRLSPLWNAGYEDADYLNAVGATDCAGGARRLSDRIDVGAFERFVYSGFLLLVQ